MAINPTTGIDDGTGTNPAVATPAQLPTFQMPTYQEGQNFSWNPNQYLPGIQQTASSIYDPQRAQIQALQQLGQSQYEQSKITTNEQFDKELTARIEAINARGAFFGGGAIDQQNQIGTNRTRAINDLTMQNQAAQAGYMAQQAGLNAAQAQYVQDQLSNAQNSSYNLWKDARAMYYDDKERQAAADDAKYGAGYSTASSKERAKMRANYKKHGSPKSTQAPNLQHFQEGGKIYTFDPATGEVKVAASYKTGGGGAPKKYAYIDSNGEVQELPAGYTYVGGLSAFNSGDSI